MTTPYRTERIYAMLRQLRLPSGEAFDDFKIEKDKCIIHLGSPLELCYLKGSELSELEQSDKRESGVPRRSGRGPTWSSGHA